MMTPSKTPNLMSPTVLPRSFKLTATQKAQFPPYVPRVRDEHEATGRVINVWELPVYRTPEHFVRPGADDHKKFASKGLPC
jgi:hypothetical protein